MNHSTLFSNLSWEHVELYCILKPVMLFNLFRCLIFFVQFHLQKNIVSLHCLFLPKSKACIFPSHHK